MENLYTGCESCAGSSRLPPEGGNVVGGDECPKCKGAGVILTGTGKKIAELILLINEKPKLKNQVWPDAF